MVVLSKTVRPQNKRREKKDDIATVDLFWINFIIPFLFLVSSGWMALFVRAFIRALEMVKHKQAKQLERIALHLQRRCGRC